MDYLKTHDWIIEGLCECADHNGGVQMSDAVTAELRKLLEGISDSFH